MAKFSNPIQLTPVDGTLWAELAGSGAPITGVAGTAEYGALSPVAYNVLSEENTDG